MASRVKKTSLLGFIASVLSFLFSRRVQEPTTEDLASADFKSSTQRLGISFTDRIRSVFRFRWIKKT
jgi:hypothetical protein